MIPIEDLTDVTLAIEDTDEDDEEDEEDLTDKTLVSRVSHFGVIFLNDLASSRDGCLSHSGTRKI